MNNQKTYSIIIPHKNSPDLLQRCVDSIPKRNDIQIIIIDDNSDFDRKPQVVRDGLDTILLNSTESKGAGRARNVGLDKAVGKWLLFADADDFFSSSLEELLDKYSDDEETDMVILNARQVDEEGHSSSLRMNMYINNYLKHRFYSEKVLRYGLWTPWSRMVKKSMVDRYNIRFEEVPTGNDMMFCLKCSQYANKIAAEPVMVYNYFKPTGRSLTDALSKEISSIEPKIDRTFRRLSLYKEVNYIFEPQHIRSRYNANKIDKEYLKLYNDLLHKYSYSNTRDLKNFLVQCIGKVFHII